MYNLLYINESDVGNYDFLRDFIELGSIEEVCTLVHTFSEATKKISFKDIVGVKKDDEGHFFFIIGEDGSFDLFRFIKDNFDVDCLLTCLNIRQVFPERLSLGFHQQSGLDDLGEDEEDDCATQYMEDEAEEVRLYSLVKLPEREVANIPHKGINIGRSASKSELIVNNNSVGRLHCNVYYLDGKLYVHDYASMNGTFVNDTRVFESRDMVLTVGDRLRVANEVFEVN